jgi:hypothetical protein
MFDVAAGDDLTGLVAAYRKDRLRWAGKVERSIAANRPAAFAARATNSFQFPRQKGWKILLFERLALFL